MSKIAVALSGGVDSSVVAFLLKQQGHKILGISLKLGYGSDTAHLIGAQVAQELKIPHHILDVSSEFKKHVILPSIRIYNQGYTPNPCVYCNQKIKFPLLWNFAKKKGCTSLATGHYVILKKELNGEILLKEGKDLKKSQAYFLSRLRPKQLTNVQFPLGNMTKKEVKQIALRAKLKKISQKESQDICFLNSNKWDNLIKKSNIIKKGKIVNEKNQILGNHEGIHKFTIGQRRGLGLSIGTPQYVLAIRKKNAKIIIGPKEKLYGEGLLAKKSLWYKSIFENTKMKVRLRYNQSGSNCNVFYKNNHLKNKEKILKKNKVVHVNFYKPQQAISPGQLAVFSINKTIMGSAWIYKSI